MEYDRALFRVYERILEDLNASPSLVAYNQSISRSRRRSRRSESTDSEQNEISGDNLDGESSATDGLAIQDSNVSEQEEGDAPSNNERRRRRRQQRTRQPRPLNNILTTRQAAEIPFFLPIGLSFKLNEMMRSISNRNGVRLGSLSVPATPTRYRSLLISSPSPTSHADSDEEQPVTDSSALNMPQLSVEESPRNGLRRRTGSSPRASPSGSLSASSTSSSASNGLVSPPLSPNSPRVMLQPRTSPSSEDYTYTSSSSSSESERPSAPAAATSLTQRAIQLQMSQRQRYRRNTNNTSGDSSDEESSDDESQSTEGDRRHEGCSQKTLYKVMRFTFGLGIFHLFVLAVLHVTYVGPTAFHRQKEVRHWRRLFPTKADEHSEGSDLLVTCVAKALATRPPQERSRYHVLFGEDDVKRRRLSEFDVLDFAIDDGFAATNATSESLDTDLYYYYDDDPWQSRLLQDKQVEFKEPEALLPLLGKDEILQIKILYGGKCTGQCSRVRRVLYPQSGRVTTKARLFHQKPNAKTINSTAANNSSGRNNLRGNNIGEARERILTNDAVNTKQQNTTNSTNHAENMNTTHSQDHNEDEFSSPEYWEDPSYRFAIDDALLYFDEKSIYLHNISIVNVTVTERCLSTGSDDGDLTFITAIGEFLSQIYGMDSIIINQLMFGIRNVEGAPLPGHVQNMETKERWGWRKEQIESYDGNTSVMEWLSKKFGIMFMSLLSFFLITSVTALIVRVLTSSGVVLMFPLFEIFRNAGVPGADERILALSYPWIGAARRAIRTSNTHPQSHLVWAHMTKIVLYYVMYEACQAAWSVVLYSKSIPEALPVWIYGLAMITEYFSMVFVRSAISVHFFPRITLVYFVAYHVYFYSVSYGYFDLALIPLSLLMTHAMLFTVFLEAPNAARGAVSVDCPREVYNKLSWPEWNSQLPPEWTIFLPLNSRQTPLHDRQVAQAEAQAGQLNGESAATDNRGTNS